MQELQPGATTNLETVPGSVWFTIYLHTCQSFNNQACQIKIAQSSPATQSNQLPQLLPQHGSIRNSIAIHILVFYQIRKMICCIYVCKCFTKRLHSRPRMTNALYKYNSPSDRATPHLQNTNVYIHPINAQASSTLVCQ